MYTLAELEEMKKKMIKMEQLLKQKESPHPSSQPTNKGLSIELLVYFTVVNSGTTNRRDANGRRLAHESQQNNNGTTNNC